MSDRGFELAGASLDWPIGSAPGLTNHPDIEVIARRTEVLAGSGISFLTLGSWTFGDIRPGSAFEATATGWDYKGGDEHVDVEVGAGYNAKSLPNCGTDIGMARLGDLADIGHSRGVEMALSFSPHSGDPLEELKELLPLAEQALKQGMLYVEINLSCPNVEGRPPFYQDPHGVAGYHALVEERGMPLNRYGSPGLRPKLGPLDPNSFYRALHGQGSRVISNTLGNQEPKLSNGEPAIKVNGGRAGMSGPALKDLGYDQLTMHAQTLQPGDEIISALGVATGGEVMRRIDTGANAVQLASVLYWPELRGMDSAGAVVDTIKSEIIDTFDVP